MRYPSPLLLSLASIALSASGQTAPEPPPQTASVEGVVTNILTGVPLPRVHVTLRDLNDHSASQYGALTTAEGKFSVTGIQPGSYSVTAARVGFAMPRGAHVGITLKADDKSSDLIVKLTPVGAISGRITDADGNPVERATVISEAARTRKYASTDEKGQFRIGALAPGKYRVKASKEAFPFRSFTTRPEIRTDGTVQVHSAATYYPGKVEVRPGSESQGIDIQLVSVPFVRVSGKLTGMPRETEDSFVTVLLPGHNGYGIPLHPDGSFEIWGLDPGKYRLIANGAESTAAAEIEVAGSNIDIQLRALPVSNIPGRLEQDPPDGAQPVSGRTVILNEVGWPSGVSPAPVAPDGTFKLAKVPAGKYAVGLSWETAYIQSMELGSSTIDGSVLDLGNGSAGAALTLSLRPATGVVSGTVLDDDGKPTEARVALISNTENTAFPTRHTKSKPDGAYSFVNVPPGNYKLLAIPDDDSNPDDYEDITDKLEIQDGDQVSLDLKRRSTEP